MAKIMKAVVWSVLVYGSGAWTMKEDIRQGIEALKFRFGEEWR